ncbi:uncharacterized protein M6B38_116575 [Iris pallida]|uniref:Uncharacterized protein n=1 Tax=Iris pallida TaxID=29817 RepID=A0AAX6I4Q9_IRIPA|nr:uncharacterized protein M6B38_116575 [Iris pallida]
MVGMLGAEVFHYRCSHFLTSHFKRRRRYWEAGKRWTVGRFVLELASTVTQHCLANGFICHRSNVQSYLLSVYCVLFRETSL